jgi:hypothetical protein
LNGSAVVLGKLYKLRKNVMLEIRLSSNFERPSCNLERLLSPERLRVPSFQEVFNLLKDVCSELFASRKRVVHR